MIGFAPTAAFEAFPGLRINRACEFAGMATLAQLELLTRTLFPAFRDEFSSLVADEGLLIRIEEATAIGALKSEVFYRPSDAIVGLVARIFATVPAHDGWLEVNIVWLHGWPFPVIAATVGQEGWISKSSTAAPRQGRAGAIHGGEVCPTFPAVDHTAFGDDVCSCRDCRR